MTRLGIPVPPGFTVTSPACNDYLQSGGSFPEGLWDQVVDALHAIEAQTGKCARRSDRTRSSWRADREPSSRCPG